MSKIYNTLEKEVDQLESIENWSTRVNKMKEIKDKINVEQQKLNDLINIVLKDDVKEVANKNKTINLEKLINNFKQSENLDDKIKYYHLINSYINEVEKQLFSS